VQADRARGDRKTQALAPGAAMRPRRIDAVEGLEDQPQVLLRHARSVIAHTHLDQLRRRCGRAAARRDSDDRGGRAVAHRVADHVLKGAA